LKFLEMRLGWTLEPKTGEPALAWHGLQEIVAGPGGQAQSAAAIRNLADDPIAQWGITLGSPSPTCKKKSGCLSSPIDPAKRH
jgi:hypothetical protein